MSSKTRLWAMAILTFVLVLVIGSALTPPADDAARAGTTLTGVPGPAFDSGEPGSTTGSFDRLVHEDEHDRDDD